MRGLPPFTSTVTTEGASNVGTLDGSRKVSLLMSRWVFPKDITAEQ